MSLQNDNVRITDPGPPQQVFTPTLTRREMMDVTKDAVKEYIEDQVKAVGWWTFKTVLVAAIGGLVLAVMYVNGWRHT